MYETLHTTKIIATNCCACGRPLLDAASVAAGMGPTCRDKYGYGSIAEDVRAEANVIIHKLGVQRANGAELAEIKQTIDQLAALIGDHIADNFRSAVIAPKMSVRKLNDYTYAVTFGKVSKSASDQARSAKWRFINKVKGAKLGYNKQINLGGDEPVWALHFKASNKVAVFEVMKEVLGGALAESIVNGVATRFIVP
jgi:hypothetical protein